MTVETTNNVTVMRGNGVADTFSFDFKVLDADHLVVQRREYSTGDILHTYAASEYTLLGVGDDSGSIELDDGALDDDYEIVISRVVPLTQELDIVNQGGFYPETVEEQLDITVMGLQQIAEITDRAFVVPDNPLPFVGMFPFINADGEQSYVSGTGTDSALRTDLAAIDGGELIGFSHGGAGSVARSIAAQVRDFGVNVYEFGGIGDGATDNLAAFNATLARIKELGVNSSTFQLGGYRMLIPPGNYYLSDTFDVKGITLSIEGQGSGQAGGEVSRLFFAAAKTGIRLQNYNTIGTTTEGVPTKGADATIVRGLSIHSLSNGAASAGKYGLHARTRFVMEDCVVRDFPDHNIAVIASAGGGGSMEGNANNWQIFRVRSIESAGSGLFLDGADVNAGAAFLLDASGNQRYGIEDSSFLGNCHFAGHADVNVLGPYFTDSTNGRSDFFGMYSESGQPPSVSTFPSIFWGGLHGAGVGGGAVVIQNNLGNLTITGGVVASGTVRATGGLGSGGSSAATTPGAVTKKLPIYDQDFNLLGYLPIYDAIA